ncbi:hypothetical protein BU15DRAFT_72532 [Melanogaster broomeanus]|nr:hypothetical protein BU15DRAFT_72530 [Melanogaster broomeanus]KAF9242883.1 hypothetical protein BU15DRAFT_72532 [Melanogaster broomeanus]
MFFDSVMRARRFFEEYFEAQNQLIPVSGHKLILLNAPVLVEEDYRHMRTVKHTTNGLHSTLWRTGQVLRALRGKGPVRAGAGCGYLVVLGKETTEFLLKTLRPSAVFSGDNRDYCEVTHEIPGSDLSTRTTPTIREVTFKSFSPSRHIRRPGFQFLSNPSILGIPSLSTHDRALPWHLAVVSPETSLDALIGIKSRVKTSPTGSLPLSARIPGTKAIPSYRTSPISTPQDSPLLSLITLFPPEDEAEVEEYMNPFGEIPITMRTMGSQERTKTIRNGITQV